ncbi:hypothetical protein LZZ85_21570 [Terrimonas sp. NA20]|uniref:DUF4625 domain-containing protein n=1 Tax=Terrimonas ginsenosidimutans TaxID=2908004 RepID=A0ABS9KX50_9BACT|nr:hypothetical protein [Terrimonas ginsenosidimutans]MCG2616901.1 hypothetical protein [Terrimonas ginsenosidimutans]
MKRSVQLRLLLVISVAAISIMSYSFTPAPGGEGFEVYKNNKLVLQQFGSDMKNVKTLQLDDIRSTDMLTIKYSHCGQVGKNRHIIIRSTGNTELKNWQFANISTGDKGMTFPPAEIIKNGTKDHKVNVFYTSTEIPKERLLITLQFKS